jgi:hypothetical protein
LKQIRGQAVPSARAFRRAAELAEPHHFFLDVFGVLDDPDHFVTEGESALFRGQSGLAETSFRIAQIFAPGHEGAQAGLAISALKQGKLQQAEERMASVQNPLLKAKWFAARAEQEFHRRRINEARSFLETSLKLDSTNVLARHLEIILAKTHPIDPSHEKVLEQWLALNRPPVFVKKDSTEHFFVIWEPERGNYGQGSKTKDGLTLFTNGAIRQPLFLPSGRVRFTVRASGTQAKGLGPTLTLFWSGRLLLAREVESETWRDYEVETEIRPGESLLTVKYPNDFNDRIAYQDRNLKVEKIIAHWESNG